ncbi:MAG TPA: hypothetical protein PLP30_08575 [Clostridia bacterium]|nr:hypothetical protein [Clostridia bacterium]
MKKVFMLCLVCVCCLSLTSCRMSYVEFAEEMSIPYNAGEIRDGMYVNEEIGFSFPLPDTGIYTSAVRNTDPNFIENPGAYRMSAKSIIFESKDSEGMIYLLVTSYYQKFPEARKYETAGVYLETMFRNESVSDAVTEYRGEWREKNPVTEVTTTEGKNPDYSYYSSYDIENQKGIISFMVPIDGYYMSFIFFIRGEYPDETPIFEIIDGIKLLPKD